MAIDMKMKNAEAIFLIAASMGNNSYLKSFRFGRILFSNRDLYEGEFKDGYFSGYGTMRYRSIQNPYYSDLFDQEGVYHGQWKMGRREGEGRMTW